MLLKLFILGVTLMAGTLTVSGLTNLAGIAIPGLQLLLEFAVFMALFPTLMGLFVSRSPEDVGQAIAEREFRQTYFSRR